MYVYIKSQAIASRCEPPSTNQSERLGTGGYHIIICHKMT